jgi:transketolase
MSVAYSDAAVRLVGTHAGVGIGEDGYSQQGLEDLALMRSLPTMEVFQPGDDIETEAMITYLATSKKPAYLRLTRQDLLRVHASDYQFKPGSFPLLKTGDDIALFATGGTLQHTFAAARELSAQNVHARVYNASSLKPVDEEAVFKAAQATKLMFTVEDHSIIGGLGGAIAETVSKKRHPPLIRIGINDEFGESGTPEGLYERHGLTAAKIAERVLIEWRRIEH